MMRKQFALIPRGDYRTAVTDTNRFQGSAGRSPVLRETMLRYESADCLFGLHDIRNERDRKLSGVDMFQGCKDCNLMKADWDTTHELYRPWSDQCGPCKSAYLDEDRRYEQASIDV